MTLTVFERLILLQVLPQQGNFMTLKIVRKLREDLSFSEKEHAALEIKTDRESGTVKWRSEADQSKKIEIGPKALEIIKDQFKELDRKQILKMDHMSLYERFVLAGEEDK